MMTTNQSFNNKNIKQLDFFIFLDGCCNFAGHYSTRQPTSQNTKNKQNNIFFFFSPEGVPVSIKQEQKIAL
jgi:hypothetical protein